MHIGEHQRELVVEPLQVPVPQSVPAPVAEPVHVPVPVAAPAPVLVPVGVPA